MAISRNRFGRTNLEQEATDRGWKPLHEACNHGWLEVSRVLLEKGAHVNAKGLADDTPLHDACVNGHIEASSALRDSACGSCNESSGTYPGNSGLQISRKVPRRWGSGHVDCGPASPFIFPSANYRYGFPVSRKKITRTSKSSRAAFIIHKIGIDSRKPTLLSGPVALTRPLRQPPGVATLFWLRAPFP
ncbi:hypothetical protein AAG570_011749 [Ranatra chinensis]|uniref:Uncharacterized protein n=1 Tax=Ranatra chinensis TaxID=642074 RepID=A0ABD0YGS7_9HEMI